MYQYPRRLLLISYDSQLLQRIMFTNLWLWIEPQQHFLIYSVLTKFNICWTIQIADNERAVSVVQAGPEYDALPTFDSRNYYHINMLEAAPHYSHHQDQTALHLGYETKNDPAAWNIAFWACFKGKNWLDHISFS